MKRISTLLALALLLGFSGFAQAQVSQNVTLEVKSIQALLVTGAPSLVIDEANVEATGLETASDNTSRLYQVNNIGSRKIAATFTPPAGWDAANHTLRLAADNGGSTVDALGTTAQNLVTGIGKGATSYGLTYTFSAGPAADPLAQGTGEVIFTITQQ